MDKCDGELDGFLEGRMARDAHLVEALHPSVGLVSGAVDRVVLVCRVGSECSHLQHLHTREAVEGSRRFVVNLRSINTAACTQVARTSRADAGEHAGRAHRHRRGSEGACLVRAENDHGRDLLKCSQVRHNAALRTYLEHEKGEVRWCGGRLPPPPPPPHTMCVHLLGHLFGADGQSDFHHHGQSDGHGRNDEGERHLKHLLPGLSTEANLQARMEWKVRIGWV